MDIGERIKIERDKQGISQTNLASMSKITRSYLCKVEKSKADISIRALARIAVALKKPIKFFFKDK